jgi:tetratricopeptide (TPR) repeat protein
MNMKNGLLFALGAAAVATALGAGEAAAQRGGRATFSVTCASGARPSNQAGTGQATLNRALLPMIQAAQKQQLYQQAYDQAMQGITADANNPYNYFVAGQAAAGLSQVMRADSMFRRTVELCPEFAGEVGPMRTQLAGVALETARVAIAERNDTTAAIRNWELAAQLDSTNTDAPFYVGYFSFLRGDQERALPVFRRLVAMPAPAAADTDAVQRRMAAMGGLLDASARMLNANQNQQAVELLGAVLRADPNNRNALYYQSLALYKMQRWADLLPVTERVLRIDPLNGNEALVAFAAHRALADEAKARNQTTVENQHRMAALRLPNPDSMAVTVETVSLTTEGLTTTVRGTVKGGAARAGAPVRLEFTLTSPGGDVGSGTVTITAPARDATASFELPIQGTGYPSSFRYRLLP